MKKYNLLITKNFSKSDLDYLQLRISKKVNIIIPKDFSNPKMIDKCEIILGEPPKPNLLNKANKLKLIQIPWTGIDRLDFDSLRKYDFIVANSHSNSTAVAELAISLMLSLFKMIPIHDRYLRQGNWLKPGNPKFSPPDIIQGKNILIIGTGQIGQKIAKMLKGFCVKIDGVNLSGKKKSLTFKDIYRNSKLNSIIGNYDIIFVCLPLTKITKNLFNHNLINKCNKSAFIINISRGNIFSEKEFYLSLKNKSIAGAAIDTWYSYPKNQVAKCLPSKYPFHKLENIVLSPHRGGFVKNELPHLKDAIDNINRFVSGKPIKNIVNLESEY